MVRWTRLPHVGLGLLLFVGVSGAACAQGDPPSSDKDLVIEVNWAKWPLKDRLRIDAMQSEGQLPVPLVFKAGSPIGMLDAPISIPASGPEEIEIGVRQFVERPIYSFLWSGPETQPASVNVTYPILSVASRSAAREVETVLVIEDVVSVATPVARLDDGSHRLELPAEPYVQVAEFVARTKGGLKAKDAIPVFHRSGSSRETLIPISEYLALQTNRGIDPNVYATYRMRLPEAYGRNIKENWYNASLFDLFRPTPAEPLHLSSRPTKARIYIGGTLQDSTTASTVFVKKSLWREIFLRLPEYRDCQVDEKKVTPPSVAGGPYLFDCNLVPTRRR